MKYQKLKHQYMKFYTTRFKAFTVLPVTYFVLALITIMCVSVYSDGYFDAPRFQGFIGAVLFFTVLIGIPLFLGWFLYLFDSKYVTRAVDQKTQEFYGLKYHSYILRSSTGFARANQHARRIFWNQGGKPHDPHLQFLVIYPKHALQVSFQEKIEREIEKTDNPIKESITLDVHIFFHNRLSLIKRFNVEDEISTYFDDIDLKTHKRTENFQMLEFYVEEYVYKIVKEYLDNSSKSFALLLKGCQDRGYVDFHTLKRGINEELSKFSNNLVESVLIDKISH